MMTEINESDPNGKAGTIIWRKHYQPFGGELETQVGTNRIGYTGHVKDEITKLNYMGARYYDPTLGRFMGMDPAGVNPEDPRTFNRYNYANNNPYRFVDPDGREPQSQEALYEMLGMPNQNAGLQTRAKAFADTASTVSDVVDAVATDPTTYIAPGLVGAKLMGAGILAVRTKNFVKFSVLTNKEARNIADKFDLKYIAGDIPKSIQKEVGKNPVYFDKATNMYFSPDKAGHRGNNAWKRFDSSGNRSTGVFSDDGNFTVISE